MSEKRYIDEIQKSIKGYRKELYQIVLGAEALASNLRGRCKCSEKSPCWLCLQAENLIKKTKDFKLDVSTSKENR